MVDQPVQPDGKHGRQAESKSRVWMVVAIAALVIVVTVFGLRLFSSSETPVAETDGGLVESTPEQAQPPAPRPRDAVRATREPETPAREPRRAPAPLPQASEPEGPVGVHAFPPLGTRPALSGIVVPDDFELPPGYVRHHQSSDDGQMLPPILMFHPTRPPLDEYGEPMDIPADRVVPPEMAPEGLPINILDVPETEEDKPISLRRIFGSD